VDGEECRLQFGPHDGLHGSRRLAGQLATPFRQPVRGVILLDMIGDRDLTVTLPANGTRQLTLLALEAARLVGARHQFRLSDSQILDDHQPFLDAGFPAVDLIDFSYGSAPGLNDYWHTAQDTTDKLSAASLTTMGQVVAEMLAQLDQP
jgi:glutaminyl-peptide cyclotransferase